MREWTLNVGAGLLANTPYHPAHQQLNHRIREQARSHIFLRRSLDSAEHFLGFATLAFVALGQHLVQDVTRAVSIAHVDIRLG